MTRKKKYTSKTKNTVSEKTEKVDLTKDVDSQTEMLSKTKTGNNFANICHKNCFGSNNWKTFLETTPNQKSTETKKPLSEIKKPLHKKRTQTNQFNNMRNLSSKNVRLPDVNSANESSIPKNTFKDKEFNNVKGKVEPVNKLIVTKQSGIDKPSPVLTKQIAMDCEMVGVEIGVDNNMLARISLVNALGDCIYDKFVKPTEPVLDYRTHISGVREKDLENAEDFKTVQEEVSALLKDRVLVGHSLKHDLKVLFLSHPRQAIRDTSKYKRFREGKTPSLKKLAKKYLGVTIQEGEHSSVQDALAAMQLYRMFKKEWEAKFKRTNIKLKSKDKKNNISVS